MKVHVEKLKLAMSASLATAVLAASPADALEPREVFLQAEPSVVVVLASDAKGTSHQQTSGVLIGAADVVTSCKGVMEAADIVVAQGSALRPASIRQADAERDLCRLGLREPLSTARVAKIAVDGAGPQIGEDVYIVSSPRGLDRTFNRVMVSGLREVPGASARLLQLDVNPERGSFGGGVFDQNGSLVGILTPQFRQSDGANFAIPVGWIAELSTRARELKPDAPSHAAAPAPSGTTPADTRWHPVRGERWQYRHMADRRPLGTVTIEIVESAGGRVRELITKSNSPGFSLEREVRAEFSTASFQPSVQLPGGYQMIDLSPYFPPGSSFTPRTAVGKLAGDAFIPGVGLARVTWDTRVLGVEQVRVPAGQFEAWKVEGVTEVPTRYGALKLKNVVWYSTSMTRPVKLALTTPVPGHQMGTMTEYLELSAIDPAK